MILIQSPYFVNITFLYTISPELLSSIKYIPELSFDAFQLNL